MIYIAVSIVGSRKSAREILPYTFPSIHVSVKIAIFTFCTALSLHRIHGP